MVRLIFTNKTAPFDKNCNVALDLSLDSVPHVMAWYGAYFYGDRYWVTLDGRNVPMDHNGEMLAHEDT